MMKLRDKIDVFVLCVSSGYLGLVVGLILASVGEMTKEPSRITLWDAIWVPLIIVVFPFFLGAFSFTKNEGK